MNIEVKGHGMMELPDDLGPEQIQAEIKRRLTPPPTPQPSVLGQLGAAGGPLGAAMTAIKTAGEYGLPSLGPPLQTAAGIAMPWARAGQVIPLLGKALGPMGALAARTGQAGLLGAAPGLVKGDIGKAAEEGTFGAGMNVITDALLGGVARGAKMVHGGRKAIREWTGKEEASKEAFEAAKAAHAAQQEANIVSRQAYADQLRGERAEHQVKKYEALSGWKAEQTAQKKILETQQAAHAEKASQEIMDAFKERVPAFRGLPSTTEGLASAVYGKGPELLSKRFDQGFKKIIEAATGETVSLPVDVAARFKLAPAVPEISLGGKAVSKDMIDFLRASTKQMGGEELVSVDAAKAAEAALGKWTTDPKGYRAIMNALDQANIGDPTIRAEYKSAMGFFDFVNKTKALTPEGLDPQQLVKGLYSTKLVDILRKRELGDVFEGPMQAARGRPTSPLDVPKPLLPPHQPSAPRVPITPRPGPLAPRTPIPEPDVGTPSLHYWQAEHMGNALGGRGVGAAAGLAATLANMFPFLRGPLPPAYSSVPSILGALATQGFLPGAKPEGD